PWPRASTENATRLPLFEARVLGRLDLHHDERPATVVYAHRTEFWRSQTPNQRDRGSRRLPRSPCSERRDLCPNSFGEAESRRDTVVVALRRVRVLQGASRERSSTEVLFFGRCGVLARRRRCSA